jgi:general secretion pathway protein D
MSKAAGFVVLRNTEVSGRVDVWSHQSLNKEEAVNLLNTVLNEKGYAVIRNDRILTIVDRESARKRNIPVKVGSKPDQIPKTDDMVTQIIPVRYTNAVKLIENIQPLLSSYAVISANESSNAVILTDTQSNIRRMTEIIQALDTSISDIATIRVFVLQYSDATDTAKLINELFKEDSAQGTQRGGGMPPFFDRRFRGGDDASQSPRNENSEARQAATRVVAVAEERTNAVVVGAPEDVMPTIESLIKEVDKTREPLTEVRIFTLQYADATEMAGIITDIFSESAQTGQVQAASTGGGRRGRFMQMLAQGAQNQQQTPASRRDKEESKVLAKPDLRTNSVVVIAASELMPQIEKIVEDLDKNPAKKQGVYLYKIKNADVEKVAGIVQDMLQNQTGRSGSSGTRAGQSTRTTTTRNTSSGSNTSQRSNQSNP